MATLQDIQGLVDKAQTRIAHQEQEYVATVLWPEIKSMLGQCDDLEWSYRGDMSKLIYKRLNEQSLHGMPARIDLKQLRRDLQTGKVQAPTEPHKWLPW
ncbi:MAG TPA: hypothetical protein VFQ36_17810 [Ktedonobacteraceae bacterium]|nr:hypothetical protein [Ktedonobacteraceae bacterium]